MESYQIGDMSYRFIKEFRELWIRGHDMDPVVSLDPRIHALFIKVLELEDEVDELKCELREAHG